MSVFRLPVSSCHPSQLAVCFGNFFCGLLKSALRTSRAARVDYQSVIHHFDGLLQPHSDPSLSSCLHVWPTRQLKSRTHQVASHLVIESFILTADRWEKSSDCDLQQHSNNEICMWHEIRVAQTTCNSMYGVCSVWSMERVACVGRKPHNATNLMGQHNNFPLCHCHAP